VSIDPEALPRVAESVLRIDAEGRAGKAEVIFAPGPTVLAKVGESLLRVAQANRVPLNFGCLMGLCGADPGRVLLGGENLSPPSRAELATLGRFGLPAGCRMDCAARIRGPVTIAPAVEREAIQQPPIRPTGPVSVALGVPLDVRRVVVIVNGIPLPACARAGGLVCPIPESPGEVVTDEHESQRGCIELQSGPVSG